ncbi:DUF4386 domain-containing protein [Oceanobacillus damuensis]|uniref:DUF4386 domain-containing protein n=1 Tax=Oceanobacillus damuensis TaxID=937928 RepID=UPI00082FD7D6|nr:DUF4386 domain-containing protein [Oceanobacillus damuensis]
MATIAKKIPFHRKSALIAGISLIIMAFAAAFSNGLILGNLVVQGDAGTTLNNIVSSINLFNAGIFGWLIILISDIVVAWALYTFMHPINKNLSLLGAMLRLTYAAILGIAILNLVFVSLLSSSPDILLLSNDTQLQSLMMLSLEAFYFIWSVGLVIFGGHLMIISYLSFHSNHIPKIISILLFIASVGYIVIHLFSTFLYHYDGIIDVLEIAFAAPMIAGELGFGLWLLFRGGKGKNPVKRL